jgi:predicted GIY-YIG superfamily endonuclease
VSNGRTYTGQTNNFARRLKQHRGILAGGARYTSRVANGALWTPMFRVTGFATLRSVLQFELAMKRRRRPAALLPGLRGPRGRVLQLEHLFSQGQLTDEPHSPFAANGIAVECHLSVARYLEYAGLTETEFVQRRTAQGIGFTFVC